jgi:GntR family transcriptional regulator, rspAB operon transcriptional repressor
MQRNVYEELKKRIVELDLKPGDVLHEKDIAEMFSVSRTPIREALIRLEGDGLVKARPRRGTYITEISLRHLKESYAIRTHLSALVGQLSVAHATTSELDNMEQVLQKIEEQSDARTLRMLDLSFHDLVNQATHNTLLVETMTRLRNQVSRVWDTNMPAGEDTYFAGIHREFKLVLAAMKAKQAEKVTQVLRMHLMRFVNESIGFLSHTR